MFSSLRMIYKVLCICILILGAHASVNAQQKLPLKAILQDIEQQYNVRFSYRKELISSLFAEPIKGNSQKALSSLLDDILHPLGLDYKKAQGRYYIITVRTSTPTPIVKEAVQRRTPTFHIRAVVLDSTAAIPLAHASVELLELGLKTQTDRDGNITFKNLPNGTFTLSVQYVGYQETQALIRAQPVTSSLTKDTIFLNPANLSLDEVQITARESTADLSTTSKIDKMALDHIQPTSLADVLQLLPGKLAQNPNLTAVNKISLRQVNTDNMASLGTALLVNGVPISNNANMQFNHSATGRVATSYASTAGAGIDFRQISADNIESVEVIRGIPSAAHGDLTSGAIIVKTKSGEYPLHVKSRVNPTVTQFAAGQGFLLSDNKGVINVDIDYTKAVSDPRFSVLTFNRYTSNIHYHKTLGSEKPLQTNTGISYSANIGQRKPDEDDPKETHNKSSDYAYRFYSTGQWQVQQKFARTIDYALSVDYTHQKSYEQAIYSGGFPITYRMENGLSEATLVNGTYLSQLWIDGKPFNFYAKIGNKFFLETGKWNHRIHMGAEWRSSDNFGQGKTYDLTRPPRLETGAGTRPRSYSEIPALHHLSLYLEDQASIALGSRQLDIQLGLRYDNVQPNGLFSSSFDHVLSPRLNSSFTIMPGLDIRLGYGLTAKAPSLAYLAPQNAYFDAFSLNHTSENESERLILVSTYVMPTENSNLRMSVNRKKEIGLRWQWGSRSLNLTAYHEQTSNGYDYQNELSTFHVLQVPQYSVLERPVNSRPVISETPTSYRTYYVDYFMPNNGLDLLNKGLEFDVDFGKISALNTSILLNGAWMQSKSTQTTYYMLKKLQTSAEARQRVGIYPKGRGKEDIRFHTTWRIVHHIPTFRLIASFTAQTIWTDKNRYLGYEKNALGYLSINSDTRVWLTPEERHSLDPIADEDIVLNIDDTYYLTESWKPLWLFNFRLTKEIGEQLQFSFYANNVFANRPLEASTRFTTRYERRNQPLFFGLELNVKLFNK